MKSFFNKLFGNTGKVTSIPVAEGVLKLETLNPKEIEYLKTNIALAGELLKDLGLLNEQNGFEPQVIDKAIEWWYLRDLENRFQIDVNLYSNALACGWGNYLANTLRMEWYVITDNYGTEIGLYHKTNHVTIFPFKSTAKAFNERRVDLIATITSKTKEVIELQR